VNTIEFAEYRQASDKDKDAVLRLLPRRISGALMKQGEQWLLRPDILMSDVKDAEELRKLREAERAGY
jgi:hypothetical protein